MSQRTKPPFRAQQMLLAHHFVQHLRSQPVGEWPGRCLLQPCGFEQRVHPRNSMLRRLPLRRTIMRQASGRDRSAAWRSPMRAISRPFTCSITSPGRKPALRAKDSRSTPLIATPPSTPSMPISSITAGERLTTRRPLNGELPSRMVWFRGGSSGAASMAMLAVWALPRRQYSTVAVLPTVVSSRKRSATRSSTSCRRPRG